MFSQCNKMVKDSCESSAPSIRWHALALHPVLWCGGYWITQPHIYQSKEVEKESRAFSSRRKQRGGRSWFISPIREDYLPAPWHLAGGVPHCVQLDKEWWNQLPATVAQEKLCPASSRLLILASNYTCQNSQDAMCNYQLSQSAA